MSVNLKPFTAKDLIAGQQLRTVKAHDSLASALVELSTHNLLALPVYDASREAYIGFIDVIDAITALLVAGLSIDVVQLVVPYPSSVDEFVQKAEFPFNSLTIGELVNASERNPWRTVSENATVEEVLDLLSEKQLHRVAVVNAENSLVGVVSQLGALTFLYNKFQDNDALKQTKLSVSESQFSHPLITLTQGTSVYEAFQVLHSNKISGAPIVDASGALVESFSANDIKGSISSAEVFKDIYKPIEALIDSANKRWSRPERTHTISREDSLWDILSKVVNFHVHRVFVVENSRPVHVISLGDIIKAIRKLN